MTEKYSGISLYAYCANNPILFLDEDGQEPITAIIDAVTVFAVEAGMSYVGNIVLNDMDASTAFDNIRGDAGIEAAKSYGLSLFITGVGPTKALAKAANSKIG